LNTTYLSPKSRQTGAALVTGLIFMLVLTIIVVSALRSATLEERMAANARNRQLALQAAEAVLRDAEAVINSGAAPFDPFTPGSFTSDCASGLCTVAVSGSTPKWKTVDWGDTAKTRTFANSASYLEGVADQPRYIIEIAGFPPPAGPGQKCNPVLYRVTSRGQGMDNAAVFVQTMFRQRPDTC
jgi:type IV pilus assembly protein PilX